MSAPNSLRPRLMPVVISATVGLLALKVIGLATQGGYLFQPEPNSGFGRALTKARSTPAWATGEETTGATPAKKPAKEEPVSEKKPEPVQPLPPPTPSSSEREILEQLAERRKLLEERAKELDLREQLLKSAEKITQERLDELKKGESRQEPEPGKAGPDMKSIVTMYETMKPRDAAKVFEKMEPTRLAPLARQMNPKKLAEVLAAMTPETAEKLTLILMPAAARPAPRPLEPAGDELPRLTTQTNPSG